MSDEAIRAAERAVQAEQSLEAKHALRLLQQRLGIPPFPRELFTREWEEVFESSPKPGIFHEVCFHVPTEATGHQRNDPAHSCVHFQHFIHDEHVRGAPVPWSLEAVKLVDWHQRIERTAHEAGGIREVKLSASVVTKDGCSLLVHAAFLDSAGGGIYHLSTVEAVHSPCPPPVFSGHVFGLDNYYSIGRGLRERRARNIRVPGLPITIPPSGLPSVSSSTTWRPVSMVHDEMLTWGSSGSRPIHPFDLGIPAGTMRIDATSRCTCGHSGANHGTPDRSDYLTGRCLPGCPCTEFRAAFPSPEGPGVTHALPAPIPRVRATSPNTENEDLALVRTTLGLPADALIVRCESCSTLTDLPHCRACGWENGPPPVEQVN